MRLLLLVALVACGSKDSDKPPGKGGPSVDSGEVPVDTGTPPEPGVAVTIAEVAGPVCSEPSLRLARPFDTVEIPAEDDKRAWFWGGGTIVADFTGDGLLDVVLPGYWSTTFREGRADGSLAATSRLEGLDLDWASGGSAADYDGDGDLDLVITRFLKPDRLLRNDGDGFTDVSSAAGLSPALARSIGSAWADYDGDGDLDLAIGSYGFIDESGTEHEDFLPADPSFLYVNNGDGSFTDRSADLPAEAHDGYTFVVSWLDLNRDGLPELYFVNDFGVAYPNRLFWNRGGGALEADDGSSGLQLDITAMGLALGDLNSDGVLDLVMPIWNGIRVLESSPLGTWVQTGFARGIYNDIARGQKIGWGAELHDLDNDGDLDLPVVFGYLETEIYDAPGEQPDALFEQAEDGSFTDRGIAWSFNQTGDGRGFVVTDLNDDGWLDVVKRDLTGPTLVMTARCGTGHWVKLELEQPGMNRHAVGAQVRVFAGERKLLRVVQAGGTGHGSGGPPSVHVGLGEAEQIDRIEIFWPDGATSNVWELGVDRTLKISRP